MSKNLKIIQVLAKIAYVISSIVFVLSLIGSISCVIAIIMLVSVQSLGAEFVDLSRSLFDQSGMSMLSVLYACLLGAIACVSEVVLSLRAKKYFRHQLDVGTPFTYSCGEKMFKLGLWCVIVPVAVAICNAVIYVVFFAFDPFLIETEFSSVVDVSTGVIFLVLSVVFKHGAEIAERLNKNDDNGGQEIPVTMPKETSQGEKNLETSEPVSFGTNSFENNK